jgi:potassium efflux system protein
VRPLKWTTFWALWVAALLLLPYGVVAQTQSQDTQPPAAEEEASSEAPDLADLIPLATELSGRLAVLEKNMVVASDVSPDQEALSEIVTNLDGHSARLKEMRASGDYRYGQLLELKAAIQSEGDSLKRMSQPLTEAIRGLGAARKEWLEERKRWQEWQSSLLEDDPLDEVKAILQGSQQTIDTALGRISQQLKPMLASQQKVANIQAGAAVLTAEADWLIQSMRGTQLVDQTPPMLSKRYFAQTREGLGFEAGSLLDKNRWLAGGFLERQGWVMGLQVLLALVLVVIIFRYRSRLEETERWSFVAKRPVAAALFAGFAPLGVLYEGTPSTWTAAFVVVVGIPFARLFGGLVSDRWKRRGVYTLMGFLVTARILIAVGTSPPLLRLYILFASMVGLFLCLWWAVGTARRGDSPLYTWGLRLGACFFAGVLVAELAGKQGLAEFLFRASVRTIVTILAGWLLAHLARGVLEWAFRSSTMQRVSLVQNRSAALVKRLTLLTDVLVGVLVFSALLVAWRVYDSRVGAIEVLLDFGFTVGSQRFSVGLFLAAAALVYGSFLASWIVQRAFVEGTLTKRSLSAGVKASIGRLIHYALVLVGFFLALLALGFDLTKLTILFSALGIGIGFGLQAIVNNFICGLILLFERPVRVGDYIELEGKWAEIKRIGLRSTTVQTFDRADIIIPNADLISNQVTNWTLTDRFIRIIIPVGVAYGSDVPLVIDTLIKCAAAHPDLAKTPEPQVLFRSFGESSLNFDLRAHTSKIEERLPIISEVCQEIDRTFRQAGIEIAFPQRDLHLRSVVESRTLPLTRAEEP